MKQYKEALERIMLLVNDDENYIVFNDGKPVNTHFDDGIDISVDDPYDFESYGYTTDEEKEIKKSSRLTTLITISSSMTLKIFHVCDDVEYINYQIEVMPRCNVKIINMYLDVLSAKHIGFNTIIHHQGNVTYYEVNNFINKITKTTTFYLSHSTDCAIRNIYLNRNENNENLSVHLLAERGNVDVLNVSLSASGYVQTQNARVLHHDESTSSNFTAYGISKNGSSIFFNNNGFIDNGAHKSILKQKTKGIILDDTSELKALPALYIDEDDVIANHGASVGSINEDDLYYLMSRGLTREESEMLIIEAFIAPFFKDLNEDNISKKTKELIEELL